MNIEAPNERQISQSDPTDETSGSGRAVTPAHFLFSERSFLKDRSPSGPLPAGCNTGWHPTWHPSRQAHRPRPSATGGAASQRSSPGALCLFALNDWIFSPPPLRASVVVLCSPRDWSFAIFVISGQFAIVVLIQTFLLEKAIA